MSGCSLATPVDRSFGQAQFPYGPSRYGESAGFGATFGMDAPSALSYSGTDAPDGDRWWKISNAGYIGMSAEVTEIRFFSDRNCTQQIPADYEDVKPIECSGHGYRLDQMKCTRAEQDTRADLHC